MSIAAEHRRGGGAAKPVLILQHLSADGPAFLGHWLRARGQAFTVLDSQAGMAYPNDLREHSALAVLGGEMSANDALPSLCGAERLILDAMRRGCPVIGHCLGGQLMARALGARVAKSPLPEIGWHAITLADNTSAREWFGAAPPARVFQWHEEAFDLPVGATALASSLACAHQAFAVGPHLAMQFHVELDAQKLLRWAASQAPEFLQAQRSHTTVQDGATQLRGMQRYLAGQQALAARLYSRWLGARRVD